MEKIAVLAWLLLALSAAPAAAQSGATPVLPGYLSTLGCYPGQTACFIPLGPGFNASGQATLSATTSSSRVALPAGAQTVIVTNAGPATAYVNIGGSAVTATTASTPVLVGYPVVLQAGSNGYIAAITASSTAALTITTGSGIPAPNPSGGGLSGNVSNASDGVATSSTNIGTVSYSYVWNGATWDRVKGTGGALNTNPTPYQATTQIASMQKGVATSSAVGLTVPANTLFCNVVPVVANVNWESDGSNPATGASGGFPMNLGTGLQVSGPVAATIKFINQTGASGALITYECYK